jgi:hypothetical protein
MRVIVRYRIPLEEGNKIIRSGHLFKVNEQLHKDFQIEAEYAWIENGERSGIAVMDLTDTAHVVDIVERFSFGLHARIDLFPALSVEDLQSAFPRVPDIVKTYDAG